ncbi:MAG TPA: DUF5069 domain-containing protein [Candidatus Acidoferrales bacterium]|nr:DUF5069 domain-containing protein [Candidatus Acidoferrales bacterium]
MSTTAAPDLTTTAPRSGRDLLGRYAWLGRLADKVRAEHAGTSGDYVAYCGLSTGFLDRADVRAEEFDRLIREGADDAALVRYFDEHVDDAHREAANSFVLDEMKEHLDEQDAEERPAREGRGG